MIVTVSDLQAGGFTCGMDDGSSSTWTLEYEQGPLKGQVYILIDKPDGHVILAKGSIRQDSFKSVRVTLEWPDAPSLDVLAQRLRVWASCLYHEMVKPKPLSKPVLSHPSVYDRLLSEDDL